jgi:hypothetical protein
MIAVTRVVQASEDNVANTRKGIEKNLLTSMKQTVAIANGARKGYLVHELCRDYVRLIRTKTRKS